MRELGTLRDGARFCGRVSLAVPRGQLAGIAKAERIKQLLDGLVAAFQHHNAPDEACARVAATLGADAPRVADHLRDRSRAVLGPAAQPIGLTTQGVHWNPDDTRLVAAEVRYTETSEPTWSITGWFAEALEVA
jgi:hypothetical protein